MINSIGVFIPNFSNNAKILPRVDKTSANFNNLIDQPFIIDMALLAHMENHQENQPILHILLLDFLLIVPKVV